MEEKTPRPVTVAVIGVGYLGSQHARIYSELSGADLIGVVDINQDRAREVAEKSRCRFFTDYREVLGKAEAVSIVVPTSVHHPIALDFLKAGADVFVEKPITTSLAEADHLVQEAEARSAVLQVGHLERFNAAVRALEGRIKDPRFIESHRLGVFVGRGTDVDVVLDLMIHDLDIILSLVGSGVKEIRAAGVPVISPNIDIVNARLEFANGCVANVTASRISREKMRKIRIFQPDTYISLDYERQEMVVYRKSASSDAGALPKITMENVEITKEEPLKAELAAFLHAVRSRERPLVSGREGREALKVGLEVIDQVTLHAQRHPLHVS